MKNKLMSKTIRTATLLIVVVIFVTSFTVYINCGAVLGSKVETSLQVVSGDPSVLEGISFNIWSDEYYNYTKSFNGSHVSNVLRNAVSFNEIGQPKVTSYSQVYEDAYLEDYRGDNSGLNWRSTNTSLCLSEGMELEVTKYSEGKYSYVTIPEFQNDDSLKNFYYHDGSTICSIVSYLIDENFYFTITDEDIYITMQMYSNYAHPEQAIYSLTSGIFRTDGKTIENILPIEISSENKDIQTFNLVYIPQTKCLALSVAENFNDAYVYIYHLETGAVEKHFIATYIGLNKGDGEWGIPVHSRRLSLFVNDNLLTIKGGKLFACFETDKMAESVMRNHFRYEHDFGYWEKGLINTDKEQNNCFLSRDEFFYVVNIDEDYRSYQDNVFSGYKLNIHVFKEGELVFDGYMLFSQENYPTILTISDEMPFKTEDGRAVKRYVKTYSKKRSVI